MHILKTETWLLVAVVIISKSFGTLFNSKSRTHPPTRYASKPRLQFSGPKGASLSIKY